MLHGYGNRGGSFLLVLCICLYGPRIWITNQLPVNADALIPVNYDGLGDYIRNAISSSSSSTPSMLQPWLRQKQPQSLNIPVTIASTTTKPTIRIQKTDESELTDIASFLAAASQQLFLPEQQQKTHNHWQNKIDLLFAKSDIESLIRRRWRIVNMGHKATARAKKSLEKQQQQASDGINQQHQLVHRQPIVQQKDDDVFLKYLWSTNDELRNEIQIAASETGEDTVWQHHSPMILTPLSLRWFNHIQMSAIITTIPFPNNRPTVKAPTFPSSFSFFNKEKENDPSSQVVGFCEVAMLSNPMYNMNLTLDECDCSLDINNDCVISILDRQQQSLSDEAQFNFYSPAIANLAVDKTMRRQGIATKLLNSAERYISRYWINATTIGLYVSTNNKPAIRLYEKCGYRKIMTVLSSSSTSSSIEGNTGTTDDSDYMLGDMWYMSKAIKN